MPPTHRRGHSCPDNPSPMAAAHLRAGRASRGGPLLHLVVCFVLRNDGGRNAAALTHLVTALLRPCPDFSAALTSGTAACPPPTPAADARTRLASVIRILPNLFAQFLRV